MIGLTVAAAKIFSLEDLPDGVLELTPRAEVAAVFVRPDEEIEDWAF
jgi:hypothetical protein